MTANPRTDTQRVLESLADLRERLGDKLPIYIEELLKWNPQLGVVSKRTPMETISKLVRQSTDLYDFAAEQHGPAARVLDIGSGGGFPGMVWKLLQPALKLTLVERRGRKAAFLESVAHRMKDQNVQVRAEDAVVTATLDEHQGVYDRVTLMAVALNADLVRAIQQLLTPDGVMVTVRLHGAELPPELAEVARQEREDAVFLLFR